jgi:hypothetical protein
MRYRSVTGAKDFSRDVAEFVNLVGEGEYWHLLRKLGNSLNLKGYVTETDDLRFSLELQLFNLERFGARRLVILSACLNKSMKQLTLSLVSGRLYRFFH